MDEKRVADYFIIAGLSENHDTNTPYNQLITSVLPITDITVIFKNLGEQCPIGYTCIETTPEGHSADLNNGNFKSPNIQICYRRGLDKPPLVDIGVYNEKKERILPDSEAVYTTPYGRCASTGKSGSSSGTYISFRRSKTKSPYNQMVVVDLCVILNNKSEHPPHAFHTIKENLNKSYYGMIGSEVFLCYKKTILSPPTISYKPQIISRFPIQDYPNTPLPSNVPLFCLPTGANVELWPAGQSPPARPMISSFVLTSNSAQKMYGYSLTFYETFDSSNLSEEERNRLLSSYSPSSKLSQPNSEDEQEKFETYSTKSICLLSRWPFSDCFIKFLAFLHRLVFHPRTLVNNKNSNDNSHSPQYNHQYNHDHFKQVSLEHHISHFLLDVSFPTPERPKVFVQLMPGTDEVIVISQPSSRIPLPQTGASFIELLLTLGVDNTLNVLLFALSEQKILLHSLRPWVLTGVAETISAMLFPFHWQCPYIPLCPLSLHGILGAPLPFIVGIDSRCFDTFTPPDDIICIDLDTKSIFLSELKKCLNLKILPKRAARVLKNSLDKIFIKINRINASHMINQSPKQRLPNMEANQAQLTLRLELEIQEAFVRFMATILRGFRSYLLPITRAPTIGTTDPTSLFNLEDFLASRDRNYSQFYHFITKTQMFTHYIEERSFLSDKDTSLAFFDVCEERLISSDDMFSDRPVKLFDLDDAFVHSDRSVYIPAPEQSPSIESKGTGGLSTNSLMSEENSISPRKCKFGPLDTSLFHRHPQASSYLSLVRALDETCLADQSKSQLEPGQNIVSIARRTKQEVRASQKLAKRSSDRPLEWAKYLVSCSHCLWFAVLPSYITFCKRATAYDAAGDKLNDDKCAARILRYAHSMVVKMQRLELSIDEICFRVLTLLCSYYDQPALAVRVFFEMKKAGIKPNAITYGYYNKAVLESKWPDHSSKPTTVLWTKIRNVISGVALFKLHGKMRSERRALRCMPLIFDPSFPMEPAVYSSLRSAATGIVSSLQEIKSSFTTSNSNTPAKLLNSAQNRSATTREMITQWANYFSSQPVRQDDYESDDSSVGSDDLLRLSNDEDIDQSANEVSDLKSSRKLIDALERHYSSGCSTDDFMEHMSSRSENFCSGATAGPNSSRIAMKIKLTTCSRCNVCHSLLYDEEIMERWSHNESDLNTRCVYCRAKIVPTMSITIDDLRFPKGSALANTDPNTTASLIILADSADLLSETHRSSSPKKRKHGKKRTNQAKTECLISFDTDEVADIPMSEQNSHPQDENQADGHIKMGLQGAHEDNHLGQARTFTVPYLSPIVLRKELESVLESSGDICLSGSEFIDEHPIIYWNLVWYFNRINVPTHLALLCLEAKSILEGRQVPEEWAGPAMGRVIVDCLWDNEKLHTKIGKPLYRLRERAEPSTRVRAILCDEIHFSSGFLNQVIKMIQDNEVYKAMNLILNERLKSSACFSFDKNRHNLYRDLIFLATTTTTLGSSNGQRKQSTIETSEEDGNTCRYRRHSTASREMGDSSPRSSLLDIGPRQIATIGSFERDYKKAFECLNFQQVALNRFDRPPTMGSLFCRKCFKELSLEVNRLDPEFH